MKKLLSFIFSLVIVPSFIFAQSNSQASFQFLNLAVSPRVSAFGSNFLPLYDDDLLLAIHNPAVINPNMHNHIGLSFLDGYADIKAGNVVYSRTFEKYGSFIGGVRFLHYGSFERTDATGMSQGSFSAADLALTVGWGRELHPGFRLGADVNLILSSYDVWSSVALSTDVAGQYTNPSGLFNATLLIRNAGRQIDPFGTEKDILPFELAGGLSKKMKHAPLRLYMMLNALNRWDLTYEDPLNPSYTVDPITGDISRPSDVADFLDKAMRHITVGAELMPGELLRFRLGYSYRTRQEMGVQSKMGMVGFSWGIGLKLGKYQFDFSRSRDHLASAPNYFSIRTDLGRFMK